MEFKMNVKQLKEFAKEYGPTVIAILILIFIVSKVGRVSFGKQKTELGVAIVVILLILIKLFNIKIGDWINQLFRFK